jgi:hypothetical protein
VRELMHVQFTPLIPHAPPEERESQPSDVSDPAPSPAGAAAAPGADALGDAEHPAPITPVLRPRAGSLSLEPPVWSPASHSRFPRAHRDAVAATLLVHAHEGTLLSTLPKELLIEVLLPKLTYAAFGIATRQLEPSTSRSMLIESCDRARA